jgi:hypothetical protein
MSGFISLIQNFSMFPIAAQLALGGIGCVAAYALLQRITHPPDQVFLQGATKAGKTYHIVAKEQKARLFPTFSVKAKFYLRIKDPSSKVEEIFLSECEHFGGYLNAESARHCYTVGRSTFHKWQDSLSGLKL